MKVRIKYPESLDDITLKQYLQIEKLGDTITARDIIEILCEVNIDIDLIPEDVLNNYSYRAVEAISIKGDTTTSSFKLDGLELMFEEDINKITYGANKDCLTYFSDWSDMHKAMAVLYRPSNDGVITEYLGTSKYGELMLQTPMSKVLAAQEEFMKLNKAMQQYYPSLFSPSGGGDEFSLEANFGRRWSSYSEMLTLASGDPIRIKDAVKMNVHEAYTFLAYTVDKNKMENARVKQNLNK